MTRLVEQRFITSAPIQIRLFSRARSIGLVGTRAPLWLQEVFGSITSFSTGWTDCSATTGGFLIEHDRDGYACAAAKWWRTVGGAVLERPEFFPLSRVEMVT